MLTPISLEKVRIAFPDWKISTQCSLTGKTASEAELNVKAFDWCIDYLRKDFRDAATNQAFTLLWRMIGNKLGVTVAQMDVTAVCIAAIREPAMSLIILPTDFYRKFLEAPVYRMGAIVFVGYQAIALSNEMAGGRWLSIGEPLSVQIKEEAMQQEARFLTLYSEQNPFFVPNEYQRQLMSAYIP